METQTEVQTTIGNLTETVTSTGSAPQNSEEKSIIDILLHGAEKIKDAIVSKLLGGFSTQQLVIMLVALLAITGIIWGIRHYIKKRRRSSAQNTASQGNNSQPPPVSGNSSVSHSNSSGSSRQNTAFWGAGRLYIDKIDITPIYTLIGRKEWLSEIKADITVINEYNSTKTLVFEACIFVSSMLTGEKYAIFKDTDKVSKTILPLSSGNYTIVYKTDLNLIQNGDPLNRKCILQISSNLKVILRKEMELWK